MGVPPLVEPGPPLTAAQVRRWSRHLLLPEIGEVGQRRLRAARVAVVGAGGLGAPVLQYLAAAGVGTLGVIDDDDVDLTNLQRQVVHGWADVGRPKAESARDAVHRIDDGVDVVLHRVRLNEETVDDVLRGYDVVVDGTDNFPTRYLVNDACVRLGLPEVWASVLRFDAQVSVFWGRPPDGVPAVDLRDLFPEPPAAGSVPSCAEAGVVGAMCGQVGSLMATEVVKLVTGVGEPLLGRVLVLDALRSRWSEVPLRRAPTELSERGEPRASRGSDRSAGGVAELTPAELAACLRAREAGDDAFTLVDVREPFEHALAAIPGSRLVPLGALLAGDGVAEVPADGPVVLYCHHGVRSEQAALVLRAHGRDDVAHLAGGIDAWSREVDATVPRY